jgi:DNA-binding NarL/FixJ family response regulator
MLEVVLRALIVDDNALFLEAASRLLERQGLTIAGVASSVAEALAKVQEFAPDVVLVDIGLGSESGLDLARRLSDSGSAVVLISTRSEADLAPLINGVPAAGFVPKSELSAAAIGRLVSEP